MGNIFKPPCDEGVIKYAPGTSPCVKKLAPWILVSTIIGPSMAFIDSTVVNVALPVLQSDMGATVTDLQWIVESYALFSKTFLFAIKLLLHFLLQFSTRFESTELSETLVSC